MQKKFFILAPDKEIYKRLQDDGIVVIVEGTEFGP